MTLTVDFVSNQQGIVVSSGSTQVRFWDKSLTTNGVITSWLWKFAPTRTFAASGSPNLYITSASLYFAVNDRIVLSNSGGALPTGLSASVVYWVVSVAATYITVSLTQGGSAVTYSSAGSGTHSIQQGSDQQNPITAYRNIAAGTYDVTLTCNDSGGTGATSSTKTGYINAVTLAFSKPANAGLFGRITIFIYDSTNATAINRVKSTNNNLFFQSLKCTGYITKSGTATFTVYNAGGATATEIGLMVADKNVAIISGRDVIWTGKISRAVQGKLSLYDTASPFTSWSIECDSDVAKMRYQNVKAANQISYNAPPGYIINKLVEPDAATDIDWRGAVKPSLISYEGANIQYTITSADMYSQFITLADLTGYDWRTRNDWMKYAYGASGYSAGSKTVTVAAITPYTTNSFAGKWLLFVNDVNADATTNNTGIQAYGQIASNTTTVITLTSITNSGIPPASSNDVIILGNPVLDFSSDFRQPTYVSTFTMNKARQSTLQNGYEMNDMSDFKTLTTKVIAKGKTTYPSFVDIYNGVPSTGTQVASLSAKDALNTNNFFQNSTYITFRTQGYVHSIDEANKYIFLIGQNYALKVNDLINIRWSYYHGTTGAGLFSAGTFSITAIALLSASDGTPVTRVTVATTPSGPDPIPKYAMAYTERLYVADNSIVTNTVNPGDILNVGIGKGYFKAGGVDAIYGPYLTLYTLAPIDYICPHIPGCLVSKITYTEASPQTGSPLNIFGIITKTATSDQNVTLSELEVYATNYLINYSFYYRKGTFWAFVYDWFKPDIRQPAEVSENGWIRAGDEICILQNTADTPTDTQYGQYKNQWQVVGWTLDADQMIVTAELGDHERNTNTLINDKTSGINYTIT